MSGSTEAGARYVGEERILDWEGSLNARDTGGLTTADGHQIRHGALVRSDVLSRLTPSGRDALIAHGIRTVVDVRSADETAHDYNDYPFREGDLAFGVRYVNVPFSTGRDETSAEDIRKRYGSAESRAELNRLDLDHHAPGIAAIVRAIAHAEPGGVLVHCQAGKDRTGTIVALLLSIAGVDDEQIADDYALTMLNIEPLIIEWLDHMSDDEAERQRLRALAEPRREAMIDALEYLRERYGGAETYLLDAGVTRDELELLRARLVEGSAPREGQSNG